ncbi:MAG: hypothetical protein ACM369_09085 [Acidobacteriota bacterium]
MKRLFTLVGGAFLAAAFSAAAADSPKEDLKFMGIDKCKKDKFDCAWVADGFSFAGKTIHVQKFEKKADAPASGDVGGLEYGNADTFMQDVFERQANERLEKQGTKFVSGGSGDYVLKGQITEFRYPKKGAAWGGWIGQAAGSGTIVYDWKIVDKSGKTVAAVHHKILAGASYTLDRRVNNVHSDLMVEFAREHSK